MGVAGNDHLGDPLAALDDERLCTKVDDDHFDIPAIIRIDRAVLFSTATPCLTASPVLTDLERPSLVSPSGALSSREAASNLLNH